MKKTLLFCYAFLSLLLSSLYTYECTIVCMFRNEAHHFVEWIEYHRMIGVDHFLLYDDGSKDNWREVLAPYIKEGLVEVTDWSGKHSGRWFVGAQVDAFRNALQRIQGKSTWVAFTDVDEFILPMKETNLLDCISKHFPKADGIYVSWRNFGTSKVTVPKGRPFLFYLTLCSLPNHSDNCIGKSIVRPECIDPQGIWYPHHFILKPGFTYVDGDNKTLKFQGSILVTDGFHHGQYLRLNHYVLGDEDRFQNGRLRIADNDDERNLLLEHYRAFGMAKDTAILNLIKKFPQTYARIWKPYLPKSNQK